MHLRTHSKYAKLAVAVSLLLSPIIINAFAFFAHGYNSNPAASAENSIDVPNDYPTIQEAVNAANPGDTIFVEAGTYSESVTVTKDNLRLLGHGASDTSLTGKVVGQGIKLTANNVTVSGFTVKNFDTGILVNKASNCSILNNVVTGNKFGLWLSYSSTCLVKGNTAIDCEHNMRFSFSTNNTFTGNVMQGEHSYNFGLFGSSLEHYFQTIDTSNTVNGKPIIYITNAEGLTVDSRSYPNLGSLIIVNSTRITVKNIAVSNNLDGVLFAYVSASTIQSVSMTDNKIGVELFSSQNCQLLDSFVKYNMYHGILLSGAVNCQVSGNNVTSNAEGIHLSDSNSSSFQANTLNDNDLGIILDGSFDNLFFHNNLVNNSNQLEIPSLSNSQGNRFDNGVEGNYWSNYTGVDNNKDAVGDTNVPHEQVDNHPLIGMYKWVTVTKDDTEFKLELISNSLTSDFQLSPSKEKLSFNATTRNDQGITRITLPQGLIANTSFVTVDKSQPYLMNEKSNGTHTTLYLAYPSGTHQIVIGYSYNETHLFAEAGPNKKTSTNTVVNFDGNSSTSDLGITDYKWDFGDDTYGSGVTTSHSYQQAGNYTVTLEVTDKAGNRASDSLIVTVDQPVSTANDEKADMALGEPTTLIVFTGIIDLLATSAVAIILVVRTRKVKKVRSVKTSKFSR